MRSPRSWMRSRVTPGPSLERNKRRAEENKKLAKEQQRKRRPVPQEAPWPPSTVLGILRNARYAGYSSYPPRLGQREGGKRRSWHASILRDETGEPIRGQWPRSWTKELGRAFRNALTVPNA